MDWIKFKEFYNSVIYDLKNSIKIRWFQVFEYETVINHITLEKGMDFLMNYSGVESLQNSYIGSVEIRNGEIVRIKDKKIINFDTGDFDYVWATNQQLKINELNEKIIEGRNRINNHIDEIDKIKLKYLKII